MVTGITPVRIKPKHLTSEDVDFEPPHVEFGWTVAYYTEADRSTTPHVAVVRTIDRYCLALDVYEAGGVRKRINVRHIDDPRSQSPTMRQWGGWALINTREMQEIEKLRSELKALERRIASLEKRKAPKRGDEKVE